MTDVTIVVPTFNEAENVETLVAQLQDHLAGMDAEVLFVDDSLDHTPDVVRAVAAEALITVRLLHRERPQGGLVGAVLAGLDASTSAWVVVMDGDLQHPPSAVPVLYQHAIEG